MFAEKEIIGEGLIKVSKGRKIILPSYTYAEPHDQLGLFYGVSLKKIPLVKDKLRRIKIVIMKLNEFEERLTNFKTALDNIYQSNSITFKEYHEYRRIFYAMLAISEEEVSKLGKITIDEIPIRNLNITDSVYAVGNSYHLDLYPSKEIYIKTKEIQENKK